MRFLEKSFSTSTQQGFSAFIASTLSANLAFLEKEQKSTTRMHQTNDARPDQMVATPKVLSSRHKANANTPSASHSSLLKSGLQAFVPQNFEVVLATTMTEQRDNRLPARLSWCHRCCLLLVCLHEYTTRSDGLKSTAAVAGFSILQLHVTNDVRDHGTCNGPEYRPCSLIQCFSGSDGMSALENRQE